MGLSPLHLPHTHRFGNAFELDDIWMRHNAEEAGFIPDGGQVSVFSADTYLNGNLLAPPPGQVNLVVSEVIGEWRGE